MHKELSYAIVGAALEVHKTLGTGFLEKVYHRALAHEMLLRNLAFKDHCSLPVRYKGQLVGEYEADFVVDGKIIVEIKAAQALQEAHMAQARHYLAATGFQLAILLNFGSPILQRERVIKTH